MSAFKTSYFQDEVFVTTFYTARDYTDQFANLNFIINMKSLKEKEKKEKECAAEVALGVAGPSTARTEPVAGPSSVRTGPVAGPSTVRTGPVAGPSSAAD